MSRFDFAGAKQETILYSITTEKSDKKKNIKSAAEGKHKSIQ